MYGVVGASEQSVSRVYRACVGCTAILLTYSWAWWVQSPLV